MANITINIPDAQLPRVVDALCAVGEWSSIEEDGPRLLFAKGVVINYIRDAVILVERAEIERAAREAAGAPPPLDDLS